MHVSNCILCLNTHALIMVRATKLIYTKTLHGMQTSDSTRIMKPYSNQSKNETPPARRNYHCRDCVENVLPTATSGNIKSKNS